MGRLGIADDIDYRWRMANNLYGHWQSSLGTPEKVQEVASVIGPNSASDIGALSQRWLDQVEPWGPATDTSDGERKTGGPTCMGQSFASSTVASTGKHRSGAGYPGTGGRYWHSIADPAGVSIGCRKLCD